MKYLKKHDFMSTMSGNLKDKPSIFENQERPILVHRTHLNSSENHSGMLLLPLRQVFPHIRRRRSHIRRLCFLCISNHHLQQLNNYETKSLQKIPKRINV